MANHNEQYSVEAYMPFIIKTVSEVTKRYVEVENSIELSIAIEKFYLAGDSYDSDKGSFLTYAKSVMRNGIIDYLRKNSHIEAVPYDESLALEDPSTSVHDQVALKLYESFLKGFDIDFEMLADSAPVHKLTRQKLIELGSDLSKDKEIVEHLLKKKRLPITLIAKRYDISEKVIKSHKSFIIAVVIAYVKQVDIIVDWIS